MFSVFSFTANAVSARRLMPSGRNSSLTPSVSSSASYCLTRHASVAVRMRSKSAAVSESSSTRIGKRPCSSGIRSEGLREVERAARDEEDVVGPHHAVARRDRRALDERQEVALHALARDVGAVQLGAARDLVDLVEEHDAVLLDVRERARLQVFVVHQTGGLLVAEEPQRFADLELAQLLSSRRRCSGTCPGSAA